MRSKTKFWQMIGRGTRLSLDLFGPGQHKTHFNVFDYCQNLEYFSQELPPAEGSGSPPLSEALFKARLELIHTLDQLGSLDDERAGLAARLRETIGSMNDQNFLVRPHLELVERFRTPDAWESVTLGDLAALADRVAGLPDQLDPDHEDAKRFDMLLLNAQLSLLRAEPFERQRKRIQAIASALEAQQAISVIQQQLELILDVQTDEWWVDVTYKMLEQVRKKLRNLVPLIEKSRKSVIYTDFTDEIGDGEAVELPGTGGTAGESYEFMQFRKKAEQFIKDNLGDAAIAKVRSGQPLTQTDLEDLQRILVAAGLGGDASFVLASERAGNLALFVRSLVGLDRNAAKEAFAEFLDDKRYSRNQIEFVNVIIIDELTARGVVEPGRVYESQYSGLAPQGPEAIFTDADLDRLFATLERLSTVGDAG